MGKTKIRIVSETPQEEKSSLEKYKERQKKKRRESLKKEKGIRVPGLKGGERVVAVEAKLPPEEKTQQSPEGKEQQLEKQTKEKARRVKTRSKKYQKAKAKINPKAKYQLLEAVKMAKATSLSSFLGNLEFHGVVGKDKIDIEATLPHSTGQRKKIEIASKTTLKKIEDGKIDFDILIATPAMMPHLVPFAKILGPRGLMPNPKNGTISKNPSQAAKKFTSNTIRIRTEKAAPLIHVVVGKLNRPETELVENLQAIIDAIGKKNIKKAVICATMGPGIKINTETVQSDKKQSLTKSASHKFA